MTDSRALYAGLPYDSEQTLDIYVQIPRLSHLCSQEKRALPVGSFNQDLRGKGAVRANEGFWGQPPCILSEPPPPVSSQKGQEGYLGCLKPTMLPFPPSVACSILL